MKKFFNRLMKSWPTFTGAIVAIAEAVYVTGFALGWFKLPEGQFEQIMQGVGVVLANLYILFTIANNPDDPHAY